MRALSMMILALFCAGCMQIDYTGRKFPAAGDRAVKVFNAPAELPPDVYTTIGRFTVVTRPKVHVYEVEEELYQRAQSYGADALCLISSATKAVGTYNTDAEEFGTPDPEVKQKTPAKESEKFGKPVKLTSGQPLGERRVYQYLVLKKSADVKSALSL